MSSPFKAIAVFDDTDPSDPGWYVLIYGYSPPRCDRYTLPVTDRNAVAEVQAAMVAELLLSRVEPHRIADWTWWRSDSDGSIVALDARTSCDMRDNSAYSVRHCGLPTPYTPLPAPPGGPH